jgi:hypothetical protein
VETEVGAEDAAEAVRWRQLTIAVRCKFADTTSALEPKLGGCYTVVAAAFSFTTHTKENLVEKLFNYSVILQPTAKQAEEGVRAELLIAPTEYKLYKSEQAVEMSAIAHLDKDHPEAIEKHSDRLEVAVRPF